MGKMELLAPAGSMDKMKMAFLYGADAVYLGGKSFGLRAFSDNFSNEELKEAVDYAHARGKHIHVTVNIFPHNDDLKALPDYLVYLRDIGVDASSSLIRASSPWPGSSCPTCLSTCRPRPIRPTGRRRNSGMTTAHRASSWPAK